MFNKMFEITTQIGCPLQCRYCPQDVLMNAYYGGTDAERPSVMRFETFKTCIDKIPADYDIHFSGMCEPWLNPACTDMLLYAKQKGHGACVFTTLMAMQPDDYLRLRAEEIEHFVLHIPDEEGNSRFILTDEYLSLLSTVLEDVKEGRFRIDSFSCHGKPHPVIRDEIENTGIRVNSTMNDRAGNVEELQAVSRDNIASGNIVCRWCGGTDLNKNVLLPDGTVILCCMDYGLKYPLGNLLEQSFEIISEGEIKKRYRQMMKSSEYGDILCRNCSRAASADRYDI